ncbi:hypothetical protein ISN45_Aa01g034370 [Arabidopsis thaliana x Arabidopsis arenosa]|uniref:DUF4219 domain-containing protein n=1 Tax=Arabidopsis thaliana x Arabidopsis arenosa TaxID=1240361 RepID=A0A8T2CCG1_9BRAS|nr:hypothetical protein ISN45_Aa01g034370 [Arabidopsis thaliana x Arabidopsis arenosa]
MDYPKEFVAVGRSVTLEKGNYGNWKVKMRALIRGLGKEAWIATNQGWKPPVMKVTIEEFNGKISAIANEAHNLGKKYKDKKLVKKLLRCLPPRFESKRTAMETSLDNDIIDFEEVVGMMQAYELEITTGSNSSSKGLALTVSSEKNDIQELKDEMSMMAKNFNRALRRVEKKGIGHTKFDCVDARSKKKRLNIVESESDSEEDDSEDEVNGFASFVGIIEEEDESSNSEAEKENGFSSADDELDEENDVDVDEQFRKWYDNWLLLSKEKISWMEEKLTLQDENEKLKEDLALEVKKNCAEMWFGGRKK